MQREKWLDCSRAFACILVALGHLVKSFIECEIIIVSPVVSWFVYFVYLFHVQVFFFVSGYLYQKRKKTTSIGEHFNHFKYKLIDFGIPYIIFTFATYVLKLIFSGSVNKQVSDSLLTTLFRHPINQMWYLYAAIIIFLIVPTINSKKSNLIIVFTFLAAKMFVVISGVSIPVPFVYAFSWSIWFVLGMEYNYLDMSKKMKHTPLLFIVFVICSIVFFIIPIHSALISRVITFCLSILGVLGTVSLFQADFGFSIGIVKKVLETISKYLLQIYLLHTMIAASFRSVLLHMHITNIWVHTVAGLFMSFVMPILIAMICDRIPWVNVVFFPTKTVRKYRGK